MICVNGTNNGKPIKVNKSIEITSQLIIILLLSRSINHWSTVINVLTSRAQKNQNDSLSVQDPTTKCEIHISMICEIENNKCSMWYKVTAHEIHCIHEIIFWKKNCIKREISRLV